mmetsp:Transcript_46398/g.153801  ORF Transcript_46398/g.153801 Transcript_46398/m.153801 type:complete len:209 (-) Transcript_46398:701-1327(-)
MASRMALKLFSFGLRRSSTLKDWYTSAPAPSAIALASVWYCAGSSRSSSLRTSPRSGLSSSDSPVHTFPSSSDTCTTSAPRSEARPHATGKGAPAGAPPAGGPDTERRKTTSWRRSPLHSAATSARQPRVETIASARTSEGASSPRRGRPTLKSLKSSSGRAIRAHPANVTPSPPGAGRGARRRTASCTSSLISCVASRRKSAKFRSR